MPQPNRPPSPNTPDREYRVSACERRLAALLLSALTHGRLSDDELIELRRVFMELHRLGVNVDDRLTFLSLALGGPQASAALH
jgi:hypothetical protein